MALVCYAQDFTTLDWNELRIDSVLPVYTEVVPLESNYRLYDYEVTLEYPEWGTLTAREAAVVSKFDDEISDEIKVNSFVGVSRKVGMLDISFVPVVKRNGRYQKLLSARISITPRAKSRMRKAAAKPADRYAANSVLASGRWYKIAITEDGMYRLTRSALQSMGFNPDNVHLYGYGGHRLPEDWSNPEEMFDDLQEIPLYKADANTWLFWGNGLVHWEGNTRIRNTYARQAYYFLTEGDANRQIAEEASSTATVRNNYTTFTSHTLYEPEEYCYFRVGRNLLEAANYAENNQHTYTLTTPNAVSNQKLEVVFTAASTAKTNVSTTVNGSSMGSISIGTIADFIYGVEGRRTYDVSSASKGDTWQVKLTSTIGHDAHLDYLAMHYTRQLKTTNGFVAFTQTGTGTSRFTISDAGVKVMRIGTSDAPATLIRGVSEAGKYSVVVDNAKANYVAFNPSYAFPEPVKIGEVGNQNLHAIRKADMVIIVPANGILYEQAERLAQAHRDYDGMTVVVCDAQMVYNEFSSGTPDATAYRRLMKMLYDRAETPAEAPRYLLLMGDCAWDNRMLSSSWAKKNPDDYLLCFGSENSFSDTKSYVMEDYFGLLDDGEGATLTNEKTDLGVGRFPVTSVTEAKVMVDKSIAYMSGSNEGAWKNVVMFLGDDGDKNEHLIYANEVAEDVIARNPEVEVRKLMWDAYPRISTLAYNSYPDVKAIINRQMKEGALVMNYTGHAATYCLSHEFVLQLSDFASFDSKNLPLWVTAACDVMPFDGQVDNIGETAVLNKNGGALAFFGTTRTVYAYSNLQLNKQFMKYLFATDNTGRRNSIGDAIRLAKQQMVSIEGGNRENKLNYALLGDPALFMGAPTNRVVLDAINGEPATAADLRMSAGMRVKLTGHVESAGGDELTGFNGVLSARVYDSEEIVTCRNNDGKAPEAFTFADRTLVLYNGQDSVKAGRFELEFVVPIDIHYSDEEGRIVFYAFNNEHTATANGYFENFIVGGVSPDAGDDTTGPHIYLYLNHDEFANGEKVNASPYFVANLSDDSGINYSGSGIGHDILLTIDNDPSMTYVLNDYYVGEFGDFTSGTVTFEIPALESGLHKLTLRAWDVLGNTSTSTLDFVVDAEMYYTAEVFDFSGRKVWEFNSSSPRADFSMPRLPKGVYIYRRSTIPSEGKAQRYTRKIVVH